MDDENNFNFNLNFTKRNVNLNFPFKANTNNNLFISTVDTKDNNYNIEDENVNGNTVDENDNDNDDDLGADNNFNDMILDERQYALKEGYYLTKDIKVIKFHCGNSLAKIFIGEIEKLKTSVAIKRYTISCDDSLLNNIQTECEVLRTLRHPNLVDFYDYELKAASIEEKEDLLGQLNQNEGSSGSVVCNIDIIMEYIDGINLREYLNNYQQENNCTGLPMEIIVEITRNLLNGLKYLHGKGITHRHLKPENILISKKLDIKISDYGIAAKVKESSSFRQILQESPHYMAPEAALQKTYSAKVDVWSLACIIFELFSGVKPYSSLNGIDALITLAQLTSPLDYSCDEIKYKFFERPNRKLLDFLHKCWRPIIDYRFSVEDLLEHKFIIS